MFSFMETEGGFRSAKLRKQADYSAVLVCFPSTWFGSGSISLVTAVAAVFACSADLLKGT